MEDDGVMVIVGEFCSYTDCPWQTVTSDGRNTQVKE